MCLWVVCKTVQGPLEVQFKFGQTFPHLEREREREREGERDRPSLLKSILLIFY